MLPNFVRLPSVFLICPRNRDIGTFADMAEEKRAVETAEKRYAILTRESIQMSAEAGGHAELPDDVPSMLGEDVSYRLRAIVQLGAQFMRHSRRRRMTTEDINKALKTMDVQPIHGHGSLDQLAFQQTREGEIHFVEDSEVSFANIASNSYIPKYNGNTSIKSHWLAVEGVQKSSSSQQQQTNPAQPGKPPSKSGQKAVAEHLQYYDNITKAILGGDEELAKIALEDLRTNSKLVPLLPYFVNFVSNGVKTISYDIKQLTKLLHTVKVLTINPHLYLEPKPYLTLLVQAVTYCLLEPLAASINPLIDHWVLRDYAARLLAQIIHRWQTPVNQVLQSSLRALTEAFHDLSRPACTHYGAIMGLLYLGSQYVEETVIPHLPTFWPHLQTMLGDTSTANTLAKSDAHKIYGALLLAVELLIKRKLKDFEAECTKAPVPVLEEMERETRDEISIVDEKVESAVSVSKECTKPGQQNARKFYADMYEYFGDSLSMRLPKLNLHHIFKPTSRETIVSLRDPEIDGKTGEDLLHEFMEQVRLQQIREEEERKVREELERQKAIEHRKVMLRRLEIQRAEDERRRKETEMRRREDEARRRHDAEIRRLHEERVRHRERIQLEQQQLRQMEMSRHHAMQQASALQYPPVATYDRIEEHSEDDPDVDVEETSDRSPESEKSEEETYPTPSPKALSVKVSDPHKGIKLTIKLGGRPEEKGGRTDRPQVEKHKDKEYKHSKKRKQSGRSPRESSHSPWESDSYESPDPKRKSDNVYQFENRPRSATSKRMSQRETDDSDSYERVDDDQSHSQPKITLKLSKSKFMGASTSQSSPSYS